MIRLSANTTKLLNFFCIKKLKIFTNITDLIKQLNAVTSVTRVLLHYQRLPFFIHEMSEKQAKQFPRRQNSTIGDPGACSWGE